MGCNSSSHKPRILHIKHTESAQDYRISNVSKVRASGASMQVDQDLRMRDEIEMFRPQRKNPLVTLTNVALVAVAAGIATALGRELQVGLVAVPKEPMQGMQPAPWESCGVCASSFRTNTALKPMLQLLNLILPLFGNIVCRARNKVSAKQNLSL